MSQTAVQKFIATTRALFAAEADPAKRWERMPPLLQELLADPSVKEQSRTWPDCSQGGERAENLLFYEDPRLQIRDQWLDQSAAYAHTDS